jgi:VIT1/CCC1 family predicted Fe2+/Mn2+ transporter
MTIETGTRPDVAPASAFFRATAEVVAATQRVMVDRLELLRSQLTDDAKDLAVAIGVVVAAGLVFVIGWVFSAVAVSLFLSRWLAWEVAIAIVGLAHILSGAVLARGAIRRFNATRRIVAVETEDPATAQVLNG